MWNCAVQEQFIWKYTWKAMQIIEAYDLTGVLPFNQPIHAREFLMRDKSIRMGHKQPRETIEAIK